MVDDGVAPQAVVDLHGDGDDPPFLGNGDASSAELASTCMR